MERRADSKRTRTDNKGIGLRNHIASICESGFSMQDLHLLDVHDGNLPTKGLAVNAVAITQEILRCGFERESFQNLSQPSIPPSDLRSH
jgi:hypothetical protein